MATLLRIANAGAAFSLAAMVAVVAADVLLRYALNRPIAASIELIEMAIVGCVFLALPEASARGSHVSIDYLDHALPQRWLKALDRIGHAFICALLVGLAVLLARRGAAMIGRGDLSASLRYPTGLLAFLMSAAVAATAIAHAALALKPAQRTES